MKNSSYKSSLYFNFFLFLFLHYSSTWRFWHTSYNRLGKTTHEPRNKFVYKNSICFIIDAETSQGWLGTLIFWSNSTWFLLFGHVGFYVQRSNRKNVNFMAVFHLNCSWEKIIVRLCWGVVWYVRNWMLSRKGWNVDDCASMLAF